MIIRCIKRQEGPSRYQAADITKHDIRANGSGTRGVGHDIGSDLSVTECAEGECAHGDKEGRAIADLGVRAGEEHDIAGHHERRGDDEEVDAAVEAPAEEGQEDGDEGADDVWRDSVKLLGDGTGGGIDSFDDCGSEEGETLDCDVVEEENEGCGEGDRAEDAAEDFGSVNLI